MMSGKQVFKRDPAGATLIADERGERAGFIKSPEPFGDLFLP
jgi:hypothetical protein